MHQPATGPAPAPTPRPAGKFLSAKVARREDITHDLALFWIESADYPNFKPGQYCTIGVEGVERAYSISSAPHERPLLELFVELVPEGELTPKIWKLKVGDAVTLRPSAKGLFTVDPKFKKHLLVGTVTGAVPYVSFLRDYLHKGASGDKFYLVDGASYWDEFTYDKEFEAIAQAHPEMLVWLPTVSRPQDPKNENWKGLTGRANAIVEELIAKYGLTKEDTLVYLCGHPGMIEDVKARLAPKGWKLKEERFWK